MQYSEAHILKRIKICDRQKLNYDGFHVNQGDFSTLVRHSGSVTDCIARWCHLCDDKLTTSLHVLAMFW